MAILQKALDHIKRAPSLITCSQDSFIPNLEFGSIPQIELGQLIVSSQMLEFESGRVVSIPKVEKIYKICIEEVMHEELHADIGGRYKGILWRTYLEQIVSIY